MECTDSVSAYIDTVDVLHIWILKNTALRYYQHNPPHLFIPDVKYFITGSIYQRRHLLWCREAKEFVLNSIILGFKKRGWKLEEWVILDNHYHLMLEAGNNACDLLSIMNEVHKFSALWLSKNIQEAKNVDKIWHNYWDSCITYEHSYFARLNYVWYNPVKHGYVKNAEEWEFGSYYERFKKDEEYIRSIVTQFPCDKAKIKDDF